MACTLKIGIGCLSVLQDHKAVDPFVIYGKQYTDIRNSLVTSHAENAIAAFTMTNVCVPLLITIVILYECNTDDG